MRDLRTFLKNRFNPGSAGVNYVNNTPDSSGNYDFTKVEKYLATVSIVDLPAFR